MSEKTVTESISQEMGQAIAKYRKENHEVREKFAEKLQISAQTLARYESNKPNAMSIETGILFLRLLPYPKRLDMLFKMGLLQEADYINLHQSADVKHYELPTYDSSRSHLDRLIKHYESTSYTLYYFDSRRGKTELVSMTLNLEKTIESGYLTGTATVKEIYPYSCKLISPPAERYTYIYLTAKETNFEDHAVIIIPFSRRIHGKYAGGIGMMLSLSLEADAPWPCFQKVAIVSDQITKLSEEQLLAIHDEYLLLSTESINENHHDVRKVYGDSLFEEDSKFYENYLESDQ